MSAQACLFVFGEQKKCRICEFPHAASKLDKLNGAVKNILIKISNHIFLYTGSRSYK